jgi:hypothetical protein
MEPVADIGKQSERLIELLTNDHLHARISEAARHTAQTRFCTDLIIPQYERYYERVCAAEGTPTALSVSN